MRPERRKVEAGVQRGPDDEFEGRTEAAEERRPVLKITSHRARDFGSRHRARRKTKMLTVAVGEQDPEIQRVMDGPGREPGGADFRITDPEGRKRRAYEEAEKKRKKYIGTTGDSAKQATLSTCGGGPWIGSE